MNGEFKCYLEGCDLPALEGMYHCSQEHKELWARKEYGSKNPTDSSILKVRELQRRFLKRAEDIRLNKINRQGHIVGRAIPMFKNST